MILTILIIYALKGINNNNNDTNDTNNICTERYIQSDRNGILKLLLNCERCKT